MSDDKRPRIYTKAETPYGSIELTVQGSEGESTEDIEETFDEKLRSVVAAQGDLEQGEDEGVGVE